MSGVAVSVEEIGKRYRIGTAAARSDTLGELLRDAARAPFRNLRRIRRLGAFGSDADDVVWALREISFDVAHGEVLGVIGHNGAGKSTLLKILSRITRPSEGRAVVEGSVGSLLEVGTGFHPELTGRENVFLNGAILGMGREQIQRQYDAIVEFAGVEQFIHTPVKRYSSGMYLRLAFAVAAHLEPEVLIVDEVLAVGDAEFQKKSLGKMGEVTREGRTVIFVSHNMAAVQGLCDRVLLLDHGRVARIGPTDEVVRHYISGLERAAHAAIVPLEDHNGRHGRFQPVIREARLFGDGRPSATVPMGGTLRLDVRFEAAAPIRGLRFGISIEDHSGQRLLNVSPTHQSPGLIDRPYTAGTLSCEIEDLRLVPGLYYATLILSGNGEEYIDRIERAVQITVEQADVFGTGFAPSAKHGVFFQHSRWSIDGH